jgi:hypothetical protein
MSILEAAEKMTGIPYTKHCTTCGRPMVCTDCLISRLRNDWRLERAKPDSYEEWAEVARDVMELFAEEEGEQEEAQSEPAKSQSN